jgi:hypothetical protein
VSRGRHKVLLGMAAGVGKTYRMLQEGRADDRDTVVGLLETHGRAETGALARRSRGAPGTHGQSAVASVSLPAISFGSCVTIAGSNA